MSGGPVSTVREYLTIDRLLIGLIVVTGLLIYLPGLGEFPLRRWDEALYANSARHMVQNGHWIVPHTQASFWGNGFSLTPRIHKPPLMYWLQAISMLIFGINEFAVRFPSALAAIGTACVVYVIGRETYDRWTGSASAFILLMLPPVYLGSHAGRTGESDMVLVLFGSLFVWWTWRARQNRSLLVPAAIAAGLAVLTKGFGAGIFVLVLAPAIIRHWSSYLSKKGIRAAAVTVVIALPWPVYMWSQQGSYFVDRFVFRTVVYRVTRANSMNSQTAPIFDFMDYPYFKSLGWYFSTPPIRDLFLLLLVVGVGLVVYLTVRKGFRENQTPVFLLWWLGVIPVAFALLGGNHQWYLLPMAVPAAILIGRVVVTTVLRVIKDIDRTFGYTTIDFRTFLSLGLVAVALLATLYPPLGAGLADTEQRDLGVTLNNKTPAGTTVYIQADNNKNTISSERLQVFSFYVRRPLARASVSDLNNNPDIRYALVKSDSLPQLDRNYNVLLNASTNGVTAIQLE